MNIDKSRILDLLKSQGHDDKAAKADQELPSQVDTDNSQHQDLLGRLGINIQDLLGGAGGLGGLGKKLGL
ncbi:hypothetical protein [uncultured Cellulomonas sp.]|uniref:hypothetical protein n=1 Tax=uncultured Cellulomonas sp. TaxID=189682 RepID=UPI002612E9A4|nr:hypothetical protein [uncultured Cellulomonas sp.]